MSPSKVSARALAGAGTAVLTAGVLASGCGVARQDAREAKASYPLRVLSATFPARQSIAKPQTFELRVENVGKHTVPNIAVSLDSFSYSSSYPQLAARLRPVWVVEEGPGAQAPTPVQSESVSAPGGAGTVYVTTWALGALAPESSTAFEWHVMPVKAGRYSVHYSVGAGLAGRAKAVTSAGGAVTGTLTADIAAKPPVRHVNPKTGKVEAGEFPKSP